VGQAKIRKLLDEASPTVYHHTSTLRTNQLWMSGSILPEGTMPPVVHPRLGRVHTDASIRRPMKDFPALAWFTRRIEIPRCLQATQIRLAMPDGSLHAVDSNADMANAFALNRFAIGFRLADLDLARWCDHPGYLTGEGRELNETAREAGDDPRDWYVSEHPVDLMLSSEVWFSRSIAHPKLTREDWYLADMKRMVSQCRSTPGVYIPPSWVTDNQANALAAKLGLQVA
jgi:hypothetical protein